MRKLLYFAVLAVFTSSYTPAYAADAASTDASSTNSQEWASIVAVHNTTFACFLIFIVTLRARLFDLHLTNSGFDFFLSSGTM